MNHHNRGRRLPPEPLTGDEVISLMGVCSKRAPTGIRDRALICVLWRGQLRISEALALKESDLDLRECTLRVLHGKGDKSRLVVLDWQALEVLGKWLAVKRKRGLVTETPLFCTLAGEEMATSAVRLMLPRRARKAGIAKRVHAHGLRHSGASDLVADGASLVEIQHQLGHSSAATTSRYLHLLNPLERVTRLRERVW